MIRPIVGKPVSLVDIDNSQTVQDNDVVIYPNPAADQLMVRLNNDVFPENSSYQLIDRIGKLVQTGNFVAEPIDITHLQEGLYLIKLQVGGQCIVKKFTVIH
jgi:transposase